MTDTINDQKLAEACRNVAKRVRAQEITLGTTHVFNHLGPCCVIGHVAVEVGIEPLSSNEDAAYALFRRPDKGIEPFTLYGVNDMALHYVHAVLGQGDEESINETKQEAYEDIASALEDVARFLEKP